MIYKELKKTLQIEYKLMTGEYLSLSLGNETVSPTSDITIFDIGFDLNLKTFMVCDRKVVDRALDMTPTKFITIERTGTIHEFETLELFSKYICMLDNVEFINKYGQ